jgi:CheY-like chemotaxis protein
MASLSGLRILVLEDEATIALRLESLLRELGCLVPGRTGKSADALAIIETDRLGFDAATLDPKLSGDMMATLDMRGIPFVVTSGSETSTISTEFAGRPVLFSPFRLEDLKTALASLPMKRRNGLR